MDKQQQAELEILAVKSQLLAALTKHLRSFSGLTAQHPSTAAESLPSVKANFGHR